VAPSPAPPLPHWDANSPTLLANLALIDAAVHDDAVRRVTPTLKRMREWHTTMLKGLDAEDPAYVGRFRGMPGYPALAKDVEVAGILGTLYADVDAEALEFESRVQAVVAALDAMYPTPEALDDDGREAVIELAAYAHGEWVRIHPFINGNGRTARIWANLTLQRYGMPPVLAMRPRPAGRGYADAASACMNRDLAPLAAYIRKAYDALVGAVKPGKAPPAFKFVAKKVPAKKTGSR
jgi:prophage maintenance system killer protein